MGSVYLPAVVGAPHIALNWRGAPDPVYRIFRPKCQVCEPTRGSTAQKSRDHWPKVCRVGFRTRPSVNLQDLRKLS